MYVVYSMEPRDLWYCDADGCSCSADDKEVLAVCPDEKSCKDFIAARKQIDVYSRYDLDYCWVAYFETH